MLRLWHLSKQIKFTPISSLVPEGTRIHWRIRFRQSVLDLYLAYFEVEFLHNSTSLLGFWCYHLEQGRIQWERSHTIPLSDKQPPAISPLTMQRLAIFRYIIHRYIWYEFLNAMRSLFETVDIFRSDDTDMSLFASTFSVELWSLISRMDDIGIKNSIDSSKSICI
jgi:hypothetical protein